MNWTTAWAVGYVTGIVIVIAVVALIVTMTVAARRVAERAESVAADLRDVERETAPLWSVRDTNAAAAKILAGARALRLALTDEQDGT